MLVELRVKDLGVIAGATLHLGRGMTALTGETGAGKTLVVEALELVVGGRADPLLVRPGASEALVEARFEPLTGGAEGGGLVDSGDAEVILARAVQAKGRSRAWVNGRMAPTSNLAEVGGELVELHGQHAHQSLLGGQAQRAALDAFCGVDEAPRARARADLRQTAEALAALGGDARARAAQIQLLRYQLDEIHRAGLSDPEEDEDLAIEEDRLSRATAHREAAQGALTLLGGGDMEVGASAAVGATIAALAGHPPLFELAERLRAVQADLADLEGETRRALDVLEDDPERLAQVRARRQLLRELRRKYGPSLAEVIAFAADAAASLASAESHDARVAELEDELDQRRAELAAAEAVVADARRAGAPALAAAVEARLGGLAMGPARFNVEVAGGAGDQVSFLLGANPGEPALPLAKVASGGELARTMLALRLVLGAQGSHRPTLVFDEVDAGIGGEAALAVGRALAALARNYQVLVVTHLAQVAAYADHQVKVEKLVRDGRTVAELSVLDDESRLVELSRMLSGRPDSPTAREHAAELLRLARRNPEPRGEPALGTQPRRATGDVP